MLLYIIIAILMFGVLIAVHEFGHFICAKLLGVRVNEFAIGMGPKVLSHRKGETTYSLRAFPIGGFCAMEGEEEESDDPKSFCNKPAWKKFIILIAGSFMNFLTGFLIIMVLFSQIGAVSAPVITGFLDGFPLEGASGLMAGDRILSIDGHRIYMRQDINLLLSRTNGQSMDLVVERGGRRMTIDDLPLKPQEYNSGGTTQLMYGLKLEQVDTLDLMGRIKLGWYQCVDYVRMVWMSLGDLFTGAVGLKDMSGPIGIVNMIGQVGAQADTTLDAAKGILNFVAFIAINLAVMNLLPIPALDGGQILFLAVNGVYTFFTKRRMDQKYLGYVNMAGFFCLIALMVVITVSDVVKLIQ